jgi:acetyltransferase-like isoleucine patch superfamily enzyme
LAVRTDSNVGSNMFSVKIAAGVTIDDGTVVGAGSVFSKDLPPEMICVGVPIRPRPKNEITYPYK